MLTGDAVCLMLGGMAKKTAPKRRKASKDIKRTIRFRPEDEAIVRRAQEEEAREDPEVGPMAAQTVVWKALRSFARERWGTSLASVEPNGAGVR